MVKGCPKNIHCDNIGVEHSSLSFSRAPSYFNFLCSNHNSKNPYNTLHKSPYTNCPVFRKEYSEDRSRLDVFYLASYKYNLLYCSVFDVWGPTLFKRSTLPSPRWFSEWNHSMPPFCRQWLAFHQPAIELMQYSNFVTISYRFLFEFKATFPLFVFLLQLLLSAPCLSIYVQGWHSNRLLVSFRCPVHQCAPRRKPFPKRGFTFYL